MSEDRASVPIGERDLAPLVLELAAWLLVVAVLIGLSLAWLDMRADLDTLRRAVAAVEDR